ncbi:hypothetical protein [Micromonospora sp. NBC_01638]|uniref:hypothetical protein n=1 Tax=Micromonospora sp. NBC_01638 TaxID=2975982 RepID=UPI00386CB792|nr:hypothetical protein OG811_23290 [Micromonospora sp. NBC_01638]
MVSTKRFRWLLSVASAGVLALGLSACSGGGPASFQSRNLRQQVFPKPNPNSWGRNLHGIAV